MGMLDGLLGSIMGGMGGSTGSGGQPQSPLLAIALQMLQQNGGIEGILGKFQQAGFGEQADSWVSTGQNMPIDPGALGQIFGQGELGQIARQTGMSQRRSLRRPRRPAAGTDRQDDAAGPDTRRKQRPRQPGAGDAAEGADGLSRPRSCVGSRNPRPERRLAPLADTGLPRIPARPLRAACRRRGRRLHPGTRARRPRPVRHLHRHPRRIRLRGRRFAPAVHHPVDLQAADLRARAGAARRGRRAGENRRRSPPATPSMRSACGPRPVRR